MGGRCVPFDLNAVCDCCGMAGAYDFMGDLLCEKCAAGNEQEDGMSELTKVELLANQQWEGVVAKVEAERDKLREPTLEDAREFIRISCAMNAEQLLEALKQLGFYRKVQP